MINTLPPASLIVAPEASVGAAELHHRLPSVQMLERGTRRCCVSDASSQLQTTDKCHINTHKGKFDLLLVHIYIEKGCVWCEGKSTPGLSPGKCNSNTLSPRGFFFHLFSFHQQKTHSGVIKLQHKNCMNTSTHSSVDHCKGNHLTEKHCQLQN